MAALPDNKEIYDRNWSQWEEMKRLGPMSRHGQRLALNELKTLRFTSVCDIGCGPGVFLTVLLGRFPGVSAAGIDLSETAIELAKRNIPQGSFHVCDITRSAPPGGYDLVTMIDVAEHITNDLAAFEAIRNICTGHFVVLTLEGRMRDFEPEVGHVRNYQPGELKAKLEKAGFTVVRYRHWGWPLYSPLYRNASKSIDAIHKPMTNMRKFMAGLAYAALFLTWPGKGDLVVAVARP